MRAHVEMTDPKEMTEAKPKLRKHEINQENGSTPEAFFMRTTRSAMNLSASALLRSSLRSAFSVL
jgi:hypothetical protein